MIVSYSSLNRFETPKLALCNPGSVFNDGTLSNMIGFLTNVTDAEIVFNFNAPSELSFRTTLTHDNNGDEQEYIDRIFKSVQNRRLIFVDNIGYFMINDVNDGYENGESFKDVTAQSIEIELQQRMIPTYINGTYRFISNNPDEQGMIDIILGSTPLWTFDHIDDSVAGRSRTFEDVDTSMNCLSFIIDNVQDAYECIFIFDPILRVVNVYDKTNYVKETDIHLTKNDVINSLNITENAEDLYTALTVLGDDNMTISAINPLGNNTLYDFSYYTDWMSGGLGSKVRNWQELVDSQRTDYRNLNQSYYTNLDEAYNYEFELQRLNIQITLYQRCRDNIVAESSTALVGSYNAAIVENGGDPITIDDDIENTIEDIDRLVEICNDEYSSVEEELTALMQTIETQESDIEMYHSSLSLSSYFTASELEELSNYIYEGSFVDEYSIINDTMTYDEQFEQMDILFNRAKSQLERSSRPSQEFNIDVENFLFAKEFEHWSEQLETGCLINVELDTNDVAMLFLSNMTVNYEDCSLSMTFGNKFNKYDPKSLFNDALGSISRTANSLSYVKDAVYPIKNGEFDEMKESLRISRDITMAAALAADNQEVVIDASGYTGRRRNSDGSIDDHQIKITGKSIVFTDDSWESSKTAIGEIIYKDEHSQTQTAYGINAEVLYGEMIVGQQIKLKNQYNNLKFDENGLEVSNAITSIKISPNNTGGLIDIRNGTTQIFSVNQTGTLSITGTINASAGHIGAFTIQERTNAGSLRATHSNINVCELQYVTYTKNGREYAQGGLHVRDSEGWCYGIVNDIGVHGGVVNNGKDADRWFLGIDEGSNSLLELRNGNGTRTVKLSGTGGSLYCSSDVTTSLLSCVYINSPGLRVVDDPYPTGQYNTYCQYLESSGDVIGKRVYAKQFIIDGQTMYIDGNDFVKVVR